MRLPVCTFVTATILLAACTTQAEVTESGAEFQLAGTATSSEAAQHRIAVTESFQSGGTLQIGDSSADVLMTLYINHSSPYSRLFHDTLLPQLIDEFVSEGKLRIHIMTVPFATYPQSKVTGDMFVCGAAQGKGQAISALLFAQQNMKLLQSQLTTIGLDMPRFQACIKAPPATSKAEATLVPSYDINGKRYTGLPEYADLRGQMKAALMHENDES